MVQSLGIHPDSIASRQACFESIKCICLILDPILGLVYELESIAKVAKAPNTSNSDIITEL